MKNFNILGVHWKIWLLGGGFTKNQYPIERWDSLKRGGGGQFTNLKGGGLGKKEGGGVFEGGVVDTTMHTMWLREPHLC